MRELKDFVGDFKKGHVYCLAGRPGIGKTTLLKEIIKNEKDKKITVFYLETNKEWFMKGLENQKNIVVYDNASTLADIEKILRNSKADIVAIDYFQLVDGEGRNLSEKYTKTSNALKKLAEELKVPLILVSQINRRCERRVNHRPKLNDFRYATYSNLQQISDCIMFLYDGWYYGEAKERKREIIIVKNRGGEIGTIVEKYDTEHRFEDLYLPSKCWLVGKENIVEIISVSSIDDVTAINQSSVERVEYSNVMNFSDIKIFDKSGKSISIMLSSEDAEKLLGLIEKS